MTTGHGVRDRNKTTACLAFKTKSRSPTDEQKVLSILRPVGESIEPKHL